MRYRISVHLFALLLACASVSAAEPDAVAETVGSELDSPALVKTPGPNRADEPTRNEFSRRLAMEFLDTASLHWQEKRKCFTCHTNLAYLYALPTIKKHYNPATAGRAEPVYEMVRSHADELIRDRWSDKGPRWDAEVVGIAAALAYSDAETNGELGKFTRVALDRMWTLQREDGGWDWLKCDWPPMESDDHYGATVAAIAAGVAPGDYAATDAANAGMKKLKGYFANNPPPTMHNRAMLLWAARYESDLITEAERKSTIDDLLKLQRPDGGWAAASLGDWKRGDGKEQDTKTSDGYGTGFVTFVLRQADVPKSHDSIQAGVAWLKSNQRQSGRWFSRSLYKDNKHFLTHAGSAFAVMALGAYGAL